MGLLHERKEAAPIRASHERGRRTEGRTTPVEVSRDRESGLREVRRLGGFLGEEVRVTCYIWGLHW